MGSGGFLDICIQLMHCSCIARELVQDQPQPVSLKISLCNRGMAMHDPPLTRGQQHRSKATNCPWVTLQAGHKEQDEGQQGHPNTGDVCKVTVVTSRKPEHRNNNVKDTPERATGTP
mmetsp:Transcript_33255/g.55693  ORF Transcript_33255/g.55693 Transcript_33255/m.55693 type:complete len:117 (-) Transcript_33255:128-478(-)